MNQLLGDYDGMQVYSKNQQGNQLKVVGYFLAKFQCHTPMDNVWEHVNIYNHCHIKTLNLLAKTITSFHFGKYRYSADYI